MSNSSPCFWESGSILKPQSHQCFHLPSKRLLPEFLLQLSLASSLEFAALATRTQPDVVRFRASFGCRVSDLASSSNGKLQQKERLFTEFVELGIPASARSTWQTGRTWHMSPAESPHGVSETDPNLKPPSSM